MTDNNIENKQNIIKDRRLGRIDIADYFYQTDPITVQKVFSLIIPIEVKYDYALSIFQIKGFSEFFDPVEMGNQMPYYNVKIHKDSETNTIKVSFGKT